MLAILGSLVACSKVYVMAPLDVVTTAHTVNNQAKLEGWLGKLRDIKVDGVMIDVWWGICEPTSKSYKFDGYSAVFALFKKYNLKIIPVLSFHQCGGNVGDTCNIPIPGFARSSKPFWVDNDGHSNSEYIAISYDNVKLSDGRTPITMYKDFMQAFYNKFRTYIDSGAISEIEIGLGPAGELRYPSYQLAYWNYPGCGEFQSYDKEFKKLIKNAAIAEGKSNFGAPPASTGGYNARPDSHDFWREGKANNYRSEYGQWFLKKYHAELVNHGDRVLTSARAVFKKAKLSAKVAGIHWWWDSESHCAEATAGFSNFRFSDGYVDIMKMLKKHSIDLCFTCLEMSRSGQDGSDAPGLVEQIRKDAAAAGLGFEGENALPCYDQGSFDRIAAVARKGLSTFTYLRMCDDLFNNLAIFGRFVGTMHGI